MEKWIKLTERLPEIGKLVYTKNEAGYISAFTRYEHGWNTKLTDATAQDNSPVVEWLEQ